MTESIEAREESWGPRTRMVRPVKRTLGAVATSNAPAIARNRPWSARPHPLYQL